MKKYTHNSLVLIVTKILLNDFRKWRLLLSYECQLATMKSGLQKKKLQSKATKAFAKREETPDWLETVRSKVHLFIRLADERQTEERHAGVCA